MIHGVVFLICSLIVKDAFANHPIDQNLDHYIQRFHLRAINTPAGKDSALYELGKKLFFEKDLSGAKRVSCASCHNPFDQTVDWLPFSLGDGANNGRGFDRRQQNAIATKRSTPHIFNLGHRVQMPLFWDGRVSFRRRTHTFRTPLAEFNGQRPPLFHITRVLTSSLAMQAIFPILSHEEMLGAAGSNDISSLPTVTARIEALEARIFKRSDYHHLLEQAWPSVRPDNYNMGHLLEAIAHYQKHAFVINRTGWDRYLRGDKQALTLAQKRGALIFLTKGQCIRCHSGSELGGRGMHNTQIPPLTQIIYRADRGVADLNGDQGHAFKFKTPSLRNVAYTFPYMHNGIFMTLEEVVAHYNNPRASLEEMTKFLTQINYLYSRVFNQRIVAPAMTRDERALFEETKSPILASIENQLSIAEQRDLVEFLRFALSEQHWWYGRDLQ